MVDGIKKILRKMLDTLLCRSNIFLFSLYHNDDDDKTLQEKS